MDRFFYPDANRGHALDAGMRSALADSLGQLVTQVDSQRPGSALSKQCRLLRPVIDLLRRDQPVQPAVFSAYYRLVLCLLDSDGEGAAEIVDDLLAVACAEQGLSFTVFDVQALGGARIHALYLAALDTDTLQAFEFLPPAPDAARRTRASITRALALMRKVAPDLAGEFAAIVTEIILAEGSKEPGAMRFDGVSSYQLWGALALNVDEVKSDLEMMETLAHEAAHSFLFGMTVEEPLVHNDDEQLYRSPLRSDPRPMDGIYHATYVAARMHYAMRMAQRSGLLGRSQRQECEVCLAASQKAFDDGYAVVAAEADLSATGEALMGNAHAFMREHAHAA